MNTKWSVVVGAGVLVLAVLAGAPGADSTKGLVAQNADQGRWNPRDYDSEARGTACARKVREVPRLRHCNGSRPTRTRRPRRRDRAAGSEGRHRCSRSQGRHRSDGRDRPSRAEWRCRCDGIRVRCAAGGVHARRSCARRGTIAQLRAGHQPDPGSLLPRASRAAGSHQAILGRDGRVLTLSWAEHRTSRRRSLMSSRDVRCANAQVRTGTDAALGARLGCRVHGRRTVT